MLNPRVASRYAKSLLDLAIEKGQLEAVYKDMSFLQDLNRSSREFINLLRSPVVNSDLKVKAVKAVTGGKVSDLTAAFMNLLIAKKREAVLPEMITSFVNQYKVYKGIQTVKLTTAAPVSESLKNAIVDQIRATGKMNTIELEAKVDPDIIGGFVLQAGDQLIDASIAYDLKVIARQFENNDFIYKVR